MSKKKRTAIGVTCALAAEVLFGFSFLFTKTATASVSALTLLSWRFLVAFSAINICILLRLIQVNFRNKPIRPLLLIAIFQPVLYFIAETIGIDLTTASESGTIIAFYPLLTLVCSAWILRHVPTIRQIAGIGIATAGVVLIVLTQGAKASFNPVGYFLLFAALFSCSLYSVFSEREVTFTSAEKTYVMMGLGAIIFTALALIEHGINGTMAEYLALPFRSKEFLMTISYLGIGSSVAAFLLYNTAISNIGANGAASFVGVSTIVTEAASVLILKEHLSVYQIIGTALIIAGVYVANLALKKASVPDQRLSGIR